MTLRVLVTGAGGQLGSELVRVFDAPHYEVVAPTRAQCDLDRRDSVLQAVVTAEPDVVVHAGAWTAVDACEDDPDRALRVNALGTRHVQEAARIVGARLCYVSTDYVFDGTASQPYDEWAEPHPRSVYGRSKRGGEVEVDPGGLIVRCSWLCGYRGANFVKTMLRLAGERDEIGVVADQHGCPTFADDLAGAIHQLVVARMSGTFHITNQGATTWHDLARATLELAGSGPDRIRPLTTAQYPTRAARPAYSVLDNAALRLAGLPLLAHWTDSLERLVKELIA